MTKCSFSLVLQNGLGVSSVHAGPLFIGSSWNGGRGQGVEGGHLHSLFCRVSALSCHKLYTFSFFLVQYVVKMMYHKGWDQEARWKILGKENKGEGFKEVKSGALLAIHLSND